MNLVFKILQGGLPLGVLRIVANAKQRMDLPYLLTMEVDQVRLRTAPKLMRMWTVTATSMSTKTQTVTVTRCRRGR